MTNQEKEFIKDFLEVNSKNNVFRSCLTMALMSARKHTGRDPNTGSDINGLLVDDIILSNIYYAEYFTGLTLYLILLEQIGLVFCKVGYEAEDKTNGIQIALENFSDLGAGEIKALRGLRNSLAHNFGLASGIPKRKIKKKEDQLYKFCLNFNENEPAVTLNSEWEGNFNDKSDSTDTVIGVQNLCKVVEDAYKKLKSEFEYGEVELRIKNINEIKTRFTIQ